MHHLTFFLCEMIPTNLFTSCPIHYFVLISERLINTANSLDSVNMDQLAVLISFNVRFQGKIILLIMLYFFREESLFKRNLIHKILLLVAFAYTNPTILIFRK